MDIIQWTFAQKCLKTETLLKISFELTSKAPNQSMEPSDRALALAVLWERNSFSYFAMDERIPKSPSPSHTCGWIPSPPMVKGLCAQGPVKRSRVSLAKSLFLKPPRKAGSIWARLMKSTQQQMWLTYLNPPQPKWFITAVKQQFPPLTPNTIAICSLENITISKK